MSWLIIKRNVDRTLWNLSLFWTLKSSCTILKVTFHLWLLQNIDSIPWVCIIHPWALHPVGCSSHSQNPVLPHPLFPSGNHWLNMVKLFTCNTGNLQTIKWHCNKKPLFPYAYPVAQKFQSSVFFQVTQTYSKCS